eukprot:6040512-Pleurochrysis_carterae.AAC.2
MSVTRDLYRATLLGGQRMATRMWTWAATVGEQARGLSALLEVAPDVQSKAFSGRRRPCASESSRAWGAERERSASAHAMQM